MVTQGTKHKPEQERRRQILDSALDIFLEKGYLRTTMKDIMVATQLSKGAIYHYFTSKEDIFHSIIKEVEISTERDFKEFKSKSQPFDFLSFYMMDNLDYFVKLYRLNTVCHEITESEPVLSILNNCLEMYKKAIKEAIESCPNRTKEVSVEELKTAIYLMFEGTLSMAASVSSFDAESELKKVLKVVRVLTGSSPAIHQQSSKTIM
ncbi:TetR/AcrR family transcriptional regulator [Vibrio sp. HN007]|uniref:TetR/AcrR family transcriptional regulator n=1 Tax=Vibrio iocasae TaxID=3098914 RepID=UPI0035D5282A